MIYWIKWQTRDVRLIPAGLYERSDQNGQIEMAGQKCGQDTSLLDFVLLYPEFATCGCKMEPFAAPFFQHLCDLFSVYAVFRVLRKYTYIYDLHENFDLRFDVF